MVQLLGPIVDFGAWQPIEVIAATFETVDAFGQAVIDGGIEFVKVEDLTLARWIRRGAKRADPELWRSMRETCEELGISSRCVAFRIARGEMRKRYRGGIVEVAIVKEAGPKSRSITGGEPDTITAFPGEI